MADWLDVIFRAILFLVVLFIITKILGKKQISQLSMFEYVTGITIGNIGAEVVTGLEQKIHLGIIALVTTAAIPFLSGLITMKSKKMRDIIDGKGTIFIKDGKLLEDNIKRERYTIDEFLELLRKKDVFDISEVEYAILEAAGDLNVLLKKEYRPLTPRDLNLKVASDKEPQTVIMDGEVLIEPLATMGRSRQWLHTELRKLGVTVENVFLAQVNSYGEVTVDLYDDLLQVASPQERPLLYATMKKCQADLELFALGTDNEDAKKMYTDNSVKLQNAIDKVAHILKS
ncbi:DUF421 domain-containing protein [Bacillus massiliigorillae]|uniref:DUF421 domain-containing protein n=1 Tax=Bacillus massiliigorillae TaxID=1243664 RepID=UPI0003A78D64|nr:DUF421 domain-containing protein [Bacillus massiliigorillae]